MTPTGHAVRLLMVFTTSLLPGLALAATDTPPPPIAEYCQHPDLAAEYGIIWTGHDQTLTVERLAAHAAPILVTETGIKFRFDFKRTRLRFLSKLGTPFWGFRVGFQMRGVWSFDNIGYVFEFGAGSW